MSQLINILAAGVRDGSGNWLNAGTVTFYKSGTTELATVYEDAGLLTERDNPATLDSVGRLIAYQNEHIALKITNSRGSVVRVIEHLQHHRKYVRSSEITNSTVPSLSISEDAAGDGLKKLADDTIGVSYSSDFRVSSSKLKLQAISEIVLKDANGHGSTNTKIRKYSTVEKNTGSAMTLAQSATLGDSVTIVTPGIYGICVTEVAGGSEFGVSKNASSLTTDVDALTHSEAIVVDRHILNVPRTSSGIFFLTTGDVIRSHTDGSSTTTLLSMFSISLLYPGVQS